MGRSVDSRWCKAIFFMILALTLLPLILLPVISAFYHQLFQVPAVTNGVLDLEGYDLLQGKPIPLDGEWEYFPGHWIVTKPGHQESSSMFSKVPSARAAGQMPGAEPYNDRIASFRILLKNCPGDIRLLSYIKGIDSYYKVFLDGKLVAQKGDAELFLQTGHLMVQRQREISYRKTLQGVRVLPGSDVELVIELASPHITGLYATPMLTDQYTDHLRTDINKLLTAAFLGSVFVTIGCLACVFLLKDKSLSSIALLGMDLLVTVRILSQSDLTEEVKEIFPLCDYISDTLLLMIILFLPVVFLFCARQLMYTQISRRSIVRTGLYELSFMPFIFWCAMTGYLQLQIFLCLVSYIPFVFIINRIYQEVRLGIPYALTVSAILMLITSSMVMATIIDTGILAVDLSGYPLVGFVAATLLQMWIYIRRNIDMQSQAMQAENLRLRLKESETALMLSQIKPHFLYNTLIAIHVLCTEAPKTAAETVMKFATFLRTNMHFIVSKGLIPFEQELVHIQNYADIEQLRFQKRLQLRYEIETVDFTVPPLSVQPLVENAIQHGACKNIAGGTVLLKTFETADSYQVEVTDDGPGFDQEILERQMDEPHGIGNAIFRLREQMNARVKITSEPGRGTCVRIILPKEQSHESHSDR